MKTTHKQYLEFQKWVNFYLDKYGLNDWTVYFAHEKMDSVATVAPRTISRGITFSLSKEVEMHGNVLRMRETARHEVIHAMTAELAHLVGNYCSEDEFKAADEKLVCKLTNLLNDEIKE